MKKRRKWKKSRTTRVEQQLCYGLAVLAVLFVVVGLTTAIKGQNSQIVSKNTNLPKETENTNNISQKKQTEESEKNPSIRVLIMTNGFQDIVHPEVKVSANDGLKISYGTETKEYGEKKTVTVKPDSPWFQEGKITIRTRKGKVKIKSIKRGDGVPAYDGTLELYKTAEGIVIINELSVEEYLCSVVPSEMPASYELEALKAQAVCARSYAYRQLEGYAYPEYEAHVNDSTDYQVYNNSSQAESAKKAVEETKGETVKYQGKVVPTYYYSTSCGRTTNMEAWGTNPGIENGYLKSVKVCGENGDYEKNLPWYRWKAEISVEKLSDLIGLNTGKDIGTVSKVEVTKRGPGKVVLQIKATGDKGSVTVETENKIRRALGGTGYEIEKQDGNKTPSTKLLPSAFFKIKKKGKKFIIEGGGFGHGIGMSQNGANEMAKQGKNYREILQLFYSDISIE